MLHICLYVVRYICLYVVRYICLYIHICFNIQLKKQTSSPIETSYQFIFANDFRVLNIQQLISFRKRIILPLSVPRQIPRTKQCTI